MTDQDPQPQLPEPEMPASEDFVDTFFTQDLVSSDTKSDDGPRENTSIQPPTGRAALANPDRAERR